MRDLPSVQIGKDLTVFYKNEAETRNIIREIFEHHIYYLELENPDPVIIDVGAHIGIATLYFKKIFPSASVFAFEPNPHLFNLLKLNIQVNQLTQVEALPLAISDKQGQAEFYIDKTKTNWQSSGSLQPGGWDKDQPLAPIIVKTSLLSSFLDYPVDILKLDIEGFEWPVLNEIKEHLNLVKNLIIEYHPGDQARASDITSLLESKGFKTEISQNLHKGLGLRIIQARKL